MYTNGYCGPHVNTYRLGYQLHLRPTRYGRWVLCIHRASNEGDMSKLKSKPGQPEYEKLANTLARSWHTVRPCVTCGYPALDGRLCSNESCKCGCGSASKCECVWETP